MESAIATILRLTYNPVAITLTDDLPAGPALRFAEGRWGCVMWPFAAVAAKGKTAVFSRTTYGCPGGGTGLGFGNTYETGALGGLEGFCHVLSHGMAGTGLEGRYSGDLSQMPDERREMQLYGERFRKTPEKVREFLENLPVCEVPTKYVVFSPLRDIWEGSDPAPSVVVFLANADQLSCLVHLIAYPTGSIEAAYCPTGAAACHSIGICAYREAASDDPRGVIGMTDISARLNVRSMLGSDLLTFAVSWAVFLRMESDVEGSFMTGPLMERLFPE
ncbi:MAG: DUF169 domain-containing protein [Methanomicrobiaceae archaeon]|nr:DUF169 domain-containing protein [Methanomicrobiaceae archaeon]